MLSICIYLELHTYIYIYGIPACSTSSSQPVRSEQKDTLQMKMETEAWWWNEGSFASPKSIHEKKNKAQIHSKMVWVWCSSRETYNIYIYTHYNMQHHMYTYIYIICKHHLLNRQANEAQRLQDKQLGLTQPRGEGRGYQQIEDPKKGSYNKNWQQLVGFT